MKLITLVCCCALLVAVFAPATTSAQDEGKTEHYTVWFGGHYTGFDDYSKKVGEYWLSKEDPLPEFGLSYYSRSGNSSFSFGGHYFDYENINARAAATVGNRFSTSFQYRSLTRQLQQDLLSNMETREWVGTKPGGKILTHEITDPNADYNYARREILTKLNFLISRKNNIRLIAAHRTILKNGHEQKVSSDHCFSCHLTSEGAKVDRYSHQVEAGLQGEFGKYDVGYTFGYRVFESQVPPSEAFYDPSVHPVTGVGTEFGSRVVYDDTVQAFSLLPKIEKFSHKLRLKGDVGKGRFAGSISYNRTRNKGTDLAADAWVGVASYALPINNRTRLVARVTGKRLTADDVFVDLPTFRDGRPGFQGNFDFTRYSSLDRADGSASLEITRRLNKKVTVSALAGFRHIDRYDYPVKDIGSTTDRFIGQASIRYRKSMKYRTSLKYRFEKTSDPFLVSKGLFERNGSQILQPLGADGFVFYFQREELRYQDITTEPTDRHEVTWTSTWRPTNQASVTMGFKGSYDKNNDLDSLDVEHWSARPNVSLTYMPDPRWSVTTGYTFNYYKSRGPVAIALFDG